MTFHARDLTRPPTRPLTLGFLTPHNVHDPRSFSGTAHYAARALNRIEGVHLRLLGQHRRPRLGDRLTRRFGRHDDTPGVPAPSDLAGLDAVVGLVASGLLDGMPPDFPFLHVTDATPGFLEDVYGRDVSTDARLSEARVARRAVACVYSSSMMASRARSELGLTHAEVLPFGVNLDLPPIIPVQESPIRPLELLYVGTDWARKGGEIALATLAHLRAIGLAAHLTCVGRVPDHVKAAPDVSVVGFLDKSRPRHARRLASLYARAHLLILPTRGDCTPMVIAEAMAHGTPVLATDTGGISEMIGHGGAGRTLPMTARAEDWAEAIADMTRDPDAYAWMSDAARDRARTRFAWDAWARGILNIARTGIAARDARLAS